MTTLKIPLSLGSSRRQAKRLLHDLARRKVSARPMRPVRRSGRRSRSRCCDERQKVTAGGFDM